MKIGKLLLLAGILFFSTTLNAQILKGNWMMGGDATFSTNKETYPELTFKTTSFGVSPNVGYFIIDKLAIGSSARLSYVIEDNSTTERTNNFNYGIGPFVRYYFLKPEKTINVFSEVSYYFEKVNQTDTKGNSIKIKAGAVYFLNSSVGLEVALNYLNQKVNNYMTNNAVFLGVGFQIHLEKE
jgi:hypothetical protein